MIRLVEDVGADALVIGVDLLTLEYAPDWNETSSYIMAGGGYIASALNLVRGKAGQFITNVAVAAAPLAARNIRERFRQPATSRRAATRLQLQNVSRNKGGSVGRTYQPEFETVAPHAF